MNRKLIGIALAIAFAVAALALPAAAQSARVTVPSQNNFEQTVSHLKSAVGQGGMMIMATVDQGNMLSMTGLKLKATLFLVGNPTVGKQVFEQNHGAGLYLPLRIFVYEDKDGKTYLSYDRPSSLLTQFGNQTIDKTAAMLDQKLDGLAHMVAQ
jgi:uncharacterized protein (DUF302 family)